MENKTLSLEATLDVVNAVGNDNDTTTALTEALISLAKAKAIRQVAQTISNAKADDIVAQVNALIPYEVKVQGVRTRLAKLEKEGIITSQSVPNDTNTGFIKIYSAVAPATEQ